MQLKPCIISGRKVTKLCPREGRGGRRVMHKGIVLVTNSGRVALFPFSVMASVHGQQHAPAAI